MDATCAALDGLLFSRAGSYLKPVSYCSKNHQVCPICGGFKSSRYELCWACSHMLDVARQGGFEGLLADQVVCGFYAVKEWDQTYKVIRDYKEDAPSAADHRIIVKSILSLHVLGHLRCIGRKAGAPVTAWATIPSTKSSKRYGKEHPLHSMVSDILSFLPEVRLQTDKLKTRKLDEHMFTLASPMEESMRGHVLLIDDSWVTGGTAQSASLCLKKAGAQYLSIYSVAHIAHEKFIRSLDPSPLEDFRFKCRYRIGKCPWKRRRDQWSHE